MDLTGYAMSLDSLINRQTCLLVVNVVLVILLILLSWILPYIDSGIKKKKRKPKTKRKAEIEKKKKRNILIVQVVFTVIALAVGVFGIKSVAERLNALKTDAESNSFSVYEGKAYLQKNTMTTFSQLLVDYRLVTFAGSDEVYWIDMSKIDEGWVEDWGEFNGKIVYGENSKIVLKIE